MSTEINGPISILPYLLITASPYTSIVIPLAVKQIRYPLVKLILTASANKILLMDAMTFVLIYVGTDSYFLYSFVINTYINLIRCEKYPY